MRFRLASTVALCALPVFAVAQEPSNSILVLDASGSMWGQIDGTAKIDIARSVVNDLLTSLPQSQSLGLTTYGHRTKGDCKDIETLVRPGSASRDAIASAVAGLTPRGKTPMTDAVIRAAEDLKYREEPATVILVSDGIETCNPDPCAAARALENAGINLTVHVVGFDVSDPEAIRQMQCLAEETGGRYLSASSASELGSALQTVAEAPATYPVTLVATAGQNGPQIETPLIWELRSGDSYIVEFERNAQISQTLVPGTYTAAVLRPDDEANAEVTFDVTDAAQTVTLVLPSMLPDASVSGPLTAVAGSTIPVAWDGPDEKNDYISVAAPDDRRYVNYVYTREGGPAQLVMPPEPGNYQLRYVLSDGAKVLATQDITVTAASASLDATDYALVGQTIPVSWTGPNYKNDYISVAKPGDGRYENYKYTREGQPGQLLMPSEAGTYELRYVMSQDSTVLATRTITIDDVSATLDAPETAVVGQILPVEWTGPDYKNDYISVAKPGDSRYENYKYTREGSAAQLLMPSEPGTYELRYIMSQGTTVLASKTITVTEVSATLDAPATAAAGENLTVAWTGPDYKSDYISVAKPGDPRYEGYTYTREGSPLDLTMPIEPGTYELRYVMSQGTTILASQTIEVTDVQASLTLPETAPAGSKILVDWDGPGYERDYISVAKSSNLKYDAYTYTRQGSPLVLEMPSEPGTYEVRYVASSNGESVLVRKEITLTDVSANLSVTGSPVSGGVLGITWDGPDFERDFIAIAKPDAPNNKYESYAYTSKDSPLVLKMPERPGTYELRYVMGKDKRVLLRVPVTVELE